MTAQGEALGNAFVLKFRSPEGACLGKRAFTGLMATVSLPTQGCALGYRSAALQALMFRRRQLSVVRCEMV
jgi:hypothetical protein